MHRVAVGYTFTGRAVRVGRGVRLAVAVGVAVNGPVGTGGKYMSVAEGDGVATGGMGVKVSVAVGSTRAVICCSPMPRATATKRVRAMSVAATSPLKSGPNPLAGAPNSLSRPSSGIITHQHPDRSRLCRRPA